jgi:hypothetical protein
MFQISLIFKTDFECFKNTVAFFDNSTKASADFPSTAKAITFYTEICYFKSPMVAY